MIAANSLLRAESSLWLHLRQSRCCCPRRSIQPLLRVLVAEATVITTMMIANRDDRPITAVVVTTTGTGQVGLTAFLRVEFIYALSRAARIR